MLVPLVLVVLGLVLEGLAGPAPDPISPNQGAAGVAVGLAGLALASKLTGKDCEDVGIAPNLCASLYDEENCDRDSAFLDLPPGAEGVLPGLGDVGNILSGGLRRNDVESVIVKYRCKLELWTESDDYKNKKEPNYEIDQSSRLKIFNDKHINDLADEKKYKGLDEKISAYRCTCRDSTLG